MKRTLLLMLLLVVALAAGLSAAPRKPKLVLAIVIDQFRYDYLTRFRAEYHAGFDRLLTRGAVFSNASLIHFPTVTAIGHATVLSGATPSVSGIVGNEWFDRDERRHVTAVSDGRTRLLGGSGEGASPARLLVSTVGDELKMADGGKSRVIGVSLKDRAAILPAGRSADAAYWFDLASGGFVSSTYYFADLPGWVTDFNAQRLPDKHRGAGWLDHKLPEDAKAFYGNSTASPFESSIFGNEIVELFAERALAAEKLGTDEYTDVLAVSFSSNDKVGHEYGMYSPEARAVALDTDRLLERLFQAAERQAGAGNTLIVLTGDHGVSPSAEEAAARRMPGGRMPADTVRNAIQAALEKRYGTGGWVAGYWDTSIYLNLDLVAEKRLDPAEVRRAAADAALAVPHMARVYTRDQLMNGAVPGDAIDRRVILGFSTRRSPDIAYLAEPYWVFNSAGASHGSAYGYDEHVPVIFLGSGIRPGRYDNAIAVNDIAPTLATILEVETPSGSSGRVLTEMFEKP